MQPLAQALELHAAGRLDDAAAAYRELHAAHPQDSEVLFLMGVLCCDLGLYDAAVRFLDQALAITPVFPEARAQLAAALHGAGAAALTAGDPAAAAAHFTAALLHRPEFAETCNWLGLAQLQQGQNAAAELSLRQALRLDPTCAQAHNNLGLALYRQGRLTAALAEFETALRHAPDHVHARLNRANTLRVTGHADAARRDLEAVVAAHPENGDALNNLGAVCQDLGHADAALHHLQRALALSPAAPQIRWNLALSQLQLRDFANGWSNFEARWEGCEHLRGAYRMPVERAWRGESLEGKRLLLWAEQGFGDTLQFIRFAQDTAARGAVVSVAAQPELTALLASAPGVTAVYSERQAAPPYDLHCPLMSLPHRLKIGLDRRALHGGAAYLAAPADAAARWRSRIGAHGGLKVGLVWSGSARLHSAELAAIDARRSVPLAAWGPILAVRGCSFFSLQKGAAAAAAAAWPALHDVSGELHDFSDTAAVVANLDLVISVDTAVAHLAGALGRPVWLLNRFDSCWRWLLGIDDSPWYASLRQFRQPAAGDWAPVIAAVAAALGAIAG